MFSVCLFSPGRVDGCYGRKQFWVSELFRLSLEGLLCLKDVRVKPLIRNASAELSRAVSGDSGWEGYGRQERKGPEAGEKCVRIL